MSVHPLKARFHALAHRFVDRLADRGASANEITLMAMTGSLVLGSYLLTGADRHWFLLVPVWFLVRMTLETIAGMLAREHGQASFAGAYLREFGNIISNAVLFVPFALIAPFSLGWIAAIIALSVLSEFAGVLGPSIGASRRRDGPFGDIEGAVVFGVLGAWVGTTGSLPAWLHLLQPAVCLALALTIVNRLRSGIREAEAAGSRAENTKDGPA